MAEKTLDRSKDFGTVLGGGLARYEQGGLKFDAAGKLYKEPKGSAPVVAEESQDDFPPLPGATVEEAASFETEGTPSVIDPVATALDSQLEANGVKP